MTIDRQNPVPIKMGPTDRMGVRDHEDVSPVINRSLIFLMGPMAMVSICDCNAYLPYIQASFPASPELCYLTIECYI